MSDARTEVFAALADPTRWRLLEELAGRGRGTATTLATEMPVSRPAVIKHLAVLGRAGLVERRRAGREVVFAVRTEPLAETARWMASLASDWDTRLAALKRLAEEGGAADAAWGKERSEGDRDDAGRQGRADLWGRRRDRRR